MANIALASNVRQDDYGITHCATGKFVTDAGSPAVDQFIPLGFTPRHVILQNVTTILRHEAIQGMADDTAVLTTGSTGADTVVTTNTIIFNGPTLAGGGGGFTVAAEIAPASQTFYYIACG